MPTKLRLLLQTPDRQLLHGSQVVAMLCKMVQRHLKSLVLPTNWLTLNTKARLEFLAKQMPRGYEFAMLREPRHTRKTRSNYQTVLRGGRRNEIFSAPVEGLDVDGNTVTRVNGINTWTAGSNRGFEFVEPELPLPPFVSMSAGDAEEQRLAWVTRARNRFVSDEQFRRILTDVRRMENTWSRATISATIRNLEIIRQGAQNQVQIEPGLIQDARPDGHLAQPMIQYGNTAGNAVPTAQALSPTPVVTREADNNLQVDWTRTPTRPNIGIRPRNMPPPRRRIVSGVMRVPTGIERIQGIPEHAIVTHRWDNPNRDIARYNLGGRFFDVAARG